MIETWNVGTDPYPLNTPFEPVVLISQPGIVVPKNFARKLLPSMHKARWQRRSNKSLSDRVAHLQSLQSR